jgi:hypothetical protein
MIWLTLKARIQSFGNHRGFAELLQWAGKQLLIHFFSKKRLVLRAFGIK